MAGWVSIERVSSVAWDVDDCVRAAAGEGASKIRSDLETLLSATMKGCHHTWLMAQLREAVSCHGR